MNKTLEDVKKVFASTALFKVLSALGVIIVLLVVFSLGVAVGSHKTLQSVHGIQGRILKIELPDIVVLGRDQMEKAISIESDTKIEERGRIVEPSSLAVGSFIIVIGSPDEAGVIKARLIRIIPGIQSPEFLR